MTNAPCPFPGPASGAKGWDCADYHNRKLNRRCRIYSFGVLLGEAEARRPAERRCFSTSRRRSRRSTTAPTASVSGAASDSAGRLQAQPASTFCIDCAPAGVDPGGTARSISPGDRLAAAPSQLLDRHRRRGDRRRARRSAPSHRRADRHLLRRVHPDRVRTRSATGSWPCGAR